MNTWKDTRYIHNKQVSESINSVTLPLLSHFLGRIYWREISHQASFNPLVIDVLERERERERKREREREREMERGVEREIILLLAQEYLTASLILHYWHYFFSFTERQICIILVICIEPRHPLSGEAVLAACRCHAISRCPGLLSLILTLFVCLFMSIVVWLIVYVCLIVCFFICV